MLLGAYGSTRVAVVMNVMNVPTLAISTFDGNVTEVRVTFPVEPIPCQPIGSGLCFAQREKPTFGPDVLPPEDFGRVSGPISPCNHQNQNRSLSSGFRTRTNFIAPPAGVRLRPSGMVAL
jgi:hypothetical protein